MFRCSWKREVKRRPFDWFGLGPDIAIAALDDPLTEYKSDTRLVGLIASMEMFENPDNGVGVVPVDTDAFVVDRYELLLAVTLFDSPTTSEEDFTIGL